MRLSVRWVCASAVLVVACAASGGAEFVGKWQHIKDDKSIIEFLRNGESYLLVDSTGDKYPASLNKDGTLQVSGPLGPIVFSYVKRSDTLVGFGGEFKRATEAAAQRPANRESSSGASTKAENPSPVQLVSDWYTAFYARDLRKVADLSAAPFVFQQDEFSTRAILEQELQRRFTASRIRLTRITKAYITNGPFGDLGPAANRVCKAANAVVVFVEADLNDGGSQYSTVGLMHCVRGGRVAYSDMGR